MSQNSQVRMKENVGAVSFNKPLNDDSYEIGVENVVKLVPKVLSGGIDRTKKAASYIASIERKRKEFDNQIKEIQNQLFITSADQQKIKQLKFKKLRLKEILSSSK